MSLLQFLRILWARRIMIGLATGACLAAAILVVLVLPPRYQAQSRVLLDLVKPDPVTGQVIATQFARAYTKTQTELIKDYRVAGQVVDRLGWERDPGKVAGFNRAAYSKDMPLRRALAQHIINNAQARLLEGSNILEISYGSRSPEQAAQVADALRQAYIDSSLTFRRESARRNAEWYEQQAAKSQAALQTAEAAKSAFERQTGLVLQEDNSDVDSARLAALAAQGASAPAFVPAPVNVSTASSLQLAQVDAELAQASQVLGPNHPELIELRNRRASLARQVSEERAAATASANAAAAAARASAGVVGSALQQQRSRVIAQRDQLDKLRQLDSEVEIRRAEFTKTATKAAQLRQEADVGETGITVLANAITPRFPVFPNVPLILAGSLAFGFGFGVLLALLLELFARRVRGVEDLQPMGIPVLAVIVSGDRAPRLVGSGSLKSLGAPYKEAM